MGSTKIMFTPRISLLVSLLSIFSPEKVSPKAHWIFLQRSDLVELFDAVSVVLLRYPVYLYMCILFFKRTSAQTQAPRHYFRHH